ncbi:MAG: hypothetical protein H7177_09675 [Rhizobacter sp.]|nr:hypothetical protein [Bacteriovorax sp.]
MKIFPKEASAAESTPVKGGKGMSKQAQATARKKAELPQKKDVSPGEIREKLAARVETSDTAKNLALKNNSKKLGDGYMNEEFKPAPVIAPAETEIEATEEKSLNSKDFVLKSDIAKNDPKDSNTQEKLKSVIQKGGFNFNPKERETLEKILSDQ